MNSRFIRTIVLLAILAVPALGCRILTQGSYTIGCTDGSIDANWVIEGQYDNTGSAQELIVLTATDGAGTVLLTQTFPLNMGTNTLGAISVPYDVPPKYNPITVTVVTPAGGSLAAPVTDWVVTGICPGLPAYGQGSTFTDGRINNADFEQSAAIYCTDDGGISVYALYNSKGYLAFTVTKAQLAKFPEHPAQNTLIKEAKGARLYKLTSGEYQVNRMKEDNTEYVFIWNGCPG